MGEKLRLTLTRGHRAHGLGGCLLVLSLLFGAGSARAAMMEHYDLRSLALESEAVVRARQVSERQVGDFTTMRSLIVLESYAGPLAAGDTLELDYGAYSLTPFLQAAWGDAGTVSDEVFLFVKGYPDQGAAPAAVRDGSAPTHWGLVQSGLRLVVGGHVYRFVQMSNPGPFAPVAQGRDPFDVHDDPRGGVILDVPTFVGELRGAIRRADSLRRALAEPPSVARDQRLVELTAVSLPDDDLGALTRSGFDGFFLDRAAEVILTELARSKDLPAFLRAAARSGVRTWRFVKDFPDVDLARAALDANRPASERAVAVALLAYGAPMDDQYGLLQQTLLTLLADPSPERRIAALQAREPGDEVKVARDARAVIRQAVARAWTVEQNERARVVLATVARDRGFLGQLRPLPVWPLVTATHLGRQVDVRWIGTTDRLNDPWHVESVAASATPSGAAAGASFTFPLLDPDHPPQVASSEMMEVLLPDDPRFTPGAWDLRLAVVMERGKTRVTREIPLHLLVPTAAALAAIYPADPPSVSVSDAGRADAVDASRTRSEPGAIAPPSVHAASGGCSLCAASDGSTGLAGAVFTALFVLVLRRSRPRGSIVLAAALAMAIGCTRDGAAEKTAPTPSAVPSAPLGPSASSAPRAEPPKLSPLDASWFQRWTLEGGIDVAVTVPTGAGEPRPVVIGVHGAQDRNDWACSEWFATVRGYAFVLCPRGTPTTGGLAVWSSASQIVERADLALAELKKRYPAYVADGPVIYAGWSQGATLASAAVALRPGLYSRVVLVEAGHTPLSASAVVAGLQAAGSERVLVACSTAPCASFASELRRAATASGFPYDSVDVGRRGHVFDPPMMNGLAAHWAWLTESDARWARPND